LKTKTTKEYVEMRDTFLVILALVFSTASASSLGVAQAQTTSTQGAVKVTVTREPAKRLDFEVLVPASQEEVWKAFTTKEGLESWIAPSARVELSVGGIWEVGYQGAQPGGGTVLSFLPNEMLSLHAMAPEWFPTVRKERTIAVFFFDRVGERQTRVRLSQVGWKEGEEWDKAFAYLSQGNATLLNMLAKRFTNGPADWKRAASR
jgi:uncharacterized protein YndB with AHSA1/START domain